MVTALALGALIGLCLGALGGGGSILTVPALVYVLGEPIHAATTESLVIVGVTAMIAAIAHARAGRVRWAAGLVFGGIGVAASYAGTAANRAVAPDVLLLAFAGLMVIAGIAMLARQRGLARPVDPPVRRASGQARIVRLIAAALATGFLTGFLGVGGGFVIVPALVMVLGYDMPVAVGTSLLVISLNSAAALTARAGDATFHWAVIVPFTLAAVASSVAGKHLADRVRPTRLVRAFAALLFLVAAYPAITSASALIG